MLRYFNYLKEHKFWGKTISEFLNWLEYKSNKYFCIIDTETTGLPSDPYEVQLTQVACIIARYDFESNKFNEIDSFNKKLKLTQKTLDLIKIPGNRIDAILKFNHYHQDGTDYYQEDYTLQDFFEFIKRFDNPILIIQNAAFDMRYLNTRNPIVKFDNEVLDTKQILQLFYLPALQKLAESDPNYRKLIDEIGTSDRDQGLISSSMGKVGPALGLNMANYHDALTDIKLTLKMFENVIELLKEYQDLDISKYQAERIRTKRY